MSASAAEVAGSEYALSFAWTSLREDDLSLQAGLELNRAQNWTDFTEALRNFHAPQQNIVYADTAGNIGMVAPARVPTRKNGDGLVPVPGWTGEYDWTGFIPFEALPHVYNPPSGQVVTANNKVVPDSYPYLLTTDWAEPYRAERITALLGGQNKHSLGSLGDVQADQLSGMANDFLPFLLSARAEGAGAQALQERLATWDGVMRADTPEPLIFSTWYRAFTRLVLEDEVGELFEATWGFRPIFFRNVIQKQTAWCDNVETLEPETCELLAATALRQTAQELDELYGDDLENWRWGRVHYADHDHLIFGKTPLGRFFNLRAANGGDAFTVNAARYAIDGEGAAQTSGPGLRALYDLSDLERSQFIQPTGQSGNVLSPHYRDYLDRWVNVEYLPIFTGREQVKNAMGTLTLTPKR